jgi:hypothetical protein
MKEFNNNFSVLKDEADQQTNVNEKVLASQSTSFSENKRPRLSDYRQSSSPQKSQNEITSQQISTAHQMTSKVDFKQMNDVQKMGNIQIENLKKLIKQINLFPRIRQKYLIESLLKNETRIKDEDQNKTVSTSQPIMTANSTVSIRNMGNQTNKISTTLKPIYNAPKFLVILVQVHSRFNYLKELIESLKRTKYIEQTLVIFSHDVYDPEMNGLIENITFCAVSLILFKNKYFSFKVGDERTFRLKTI